jgi:hypothetical protein
LHGHRYFSSTQSAESVGRDSKHIFKGSRKMKLIVKTGTDGNLFDQRAGLLEPFGGEVHFKPHQKLVWALMVVAFKKPA